MVKKLIALSLFSLGLLSASPEQASKQGAWVAVKVGSSFSEGKPLAKFKVSGMVCEPRLYSMDFFGNKVIWAGAFLGNTSKKKMHGDFHVALFDKNKRLIGSAGQGTDLDAEKMNMQLGSCLIFAPEKELKQVKYAQWRFYVREAKK